MKTPRTSLFWAPLFLILYSLPVSAAPLIDLQDVSVAETMPPSQREAALSAVRNFYSFWNTGDESLLKQAIADNFIDRTLPKGRPQGPQGPAFASRNFRTAVPDLRCAVQKVVLAGAFVTVHMKFTGHFTGTFGTTLGNGAPIEFIATDLLEIAGGRVINNWHIEDNLTLFQQMGLVK